MRPVRRAETLSPSRADCLDIWEPQPPGILKACPGIALPFSPSWIRKSNNMCTYNVITSFRGIICKELYSSFVFMLSDL